MLQKRNPGLAGTLRESVTLQQHDRVVSGSPIFAKVVGGEQMSANLKRVLSVKGKAILARANAANAKQFAALVRQAVPQDPTQQKHLVDTVDQRTVGEVGAQVSIG